MSDPNQPQCWWHCAQRKCFPLQVFIVFFEFFHKEQQSRKQLGSIADHATKRDGTSPPVWYQVGDSLGSTNDSANETAHEVPIMHVHLRSQASAVKWNKSANASRAFACSNCHKKSAASSLQLGICVLLVAACSHQNCAINFFPVGAPVDVRLHSKACPGPEPHTSHGLPGRQNSCLATLH